VYCEATKQEEIAKNVRFLGELFPVNRQTRQLVRMLLLHDMAPEHRNIVLWCYLVVLAAALAFVVFSQ
jgi:hypothetical protein